MIFSKEIAPDYNFNVKDFSASNRLTNGNFLFNQTFFLVHIQQKPFFSFELWHTKRQQCSALLHVFVNNGVAVSPWRATFGGIEILTSVELNILNAFVKCIDLYLASQQISAVKLTNYAYGYDPIAASHITEALVYNGYEISTTETNYHISVTSEPLEKRIHNSERRRLHKCRTAELICQEETKPDLPAIYAFISRARARKGFPISLDLQAFMRLFEQMPGIYRVFTARQGDTIAALTVTVRISEQILYNFYPADNESFLTYSPTVLIISELYQLAQREGYTMLDLGIATVNGQPNPGLVRFKTNLGAQPSSRLTMKKLL